MWGFVVNWGGKEGRGGAFWANGNLTGGGEGKSDLLGKGVGTRKKSLLAQA